MEFTKHVKVRPERFGAVIFETLKEKVFVANQTGREIIALVGEGKNQEEIIEILSKSYNADRTTIKNDIDEFLSNLHNNNIVKGTK